MRKRSSQRKLRFSSSSCRFISLMYSHRATTASWRVASRMSTISASSGLSSNRSGSSWRYRLTVIFMVSSPFLLNVNSSKSAMAGKLFPPAGVLSGFFHSIGGSAARRAAFGRSKSTVMALKKCDSRGRFAGAPLGLGLVGVSVSILSASASVSFSLRSSSSASSSYSSSSRRPSTRTRYDDSRLEVKSNESTLRPLFCQNWSSTVLLIQMRIVLYRYRHEPKVSHRALVLQSYDEFLGGCTFVLRLNESTISSLLRVMVASRRRSRSRRFL